MKKYTFSFLLISLVAIALFYSCSTEKTGPEIQARTQYTLTVIASEGGSVTPEATGTYDEGATITITATPAEGYEFNRWEGSDFDDNRCAFSGPFNCRTAVTMLSDRDVEAFFQRKSE